MNTHWQTYLNVLYQHAKGHHVQQEISEVYGEILYESAEKILSQLTMTQEDVFYDLGSGLGKVVLQVFLTTKVREVCGMELIPNLHQQASTALTNLRQDFPELFMNGRTIQLMESDFMTVTFDTASIVLIGSPCFHPTMLTTLGDRIEETHCIHTVCSLRPLLTLKRLALKKMLPVECSWDTAMCYIYSNRN